MALTVEELDGHYRVETLPVGGAHGPGYAHLATPPDARTTINNGMSFSKHPNGFIWETQFTIIDGDHVEMLSTVDPSHAAASVFVSDEKGNPTKGMVTYKTVLAVTHLNDMLVLSGTLLHAGGTTAVTFTKLP